MKVFDTVHDFDYSWDEVSTANWGKYCPWNKESSHVIAVDTLSRSLDRTTGVLKTERLITCRQSAPKWLSPFLGGSEVSHVYEVSYVTPPKPNSGSPSAPVPTTSTLRTATLAPTLTDSPSASTDALPSSVSPFTPTISMTSVNLTWSDLLRVHERVTYTPCPEDPDHKTRFEQHASITAMCGGWQKVRERIEAFTVDRFGQNASKGRKGFEEVLETARRVGWPKDAGSEGSAAPARI